MILLAPLNTLGRVLIAVALLLSTTPHSHAASGLEHLASIKVASPHSHDEAMDIGHGHDDGADEHHNPGYNHGQKVGDHIHDKPCPVSVALMSRPGARKCWGAPVLRGGCNAAVPRLDRPPRGSSIL